MGLNGDDTILQIECVGERPDYPIIQGGAYESFLAQDDSHLSCERNGKLGSSSGENIYAFTPSRSGVYIISVYSNFDAVLYRVDSPCGSATALDCTDGPGANATESFSAYLDEGETQLIVVDGFNSAASGSFTLSISEATGEEDWGGTSTSPTGEGWDGTTTG